MKITKSQLRQMIKEEIQASLPENLWQQHQDRKKEPDYKTQLKQYNQKRRGAEAAAEKAEAEAIPRCAYDDRGKDTGFSAGMTYRRAASDGLNAQDKGRNTRCKTMAKVYIGRDKVYKYDRASDGAVDDAGNPVKV